MPRVHFHGQSRREERPPLRPGQYPCEIDRIEEDTTRNGDPMWRIRFQIVKGSEEGRRITDRVVFSDRAKERVGIFCRAFGIDPSGDVDLRPETFVGKRCFVTVEPDTYEDRHGQEHKTVAVTWDGFRRADTGEEPSPF